MRLKLLLASAAIAATVAVPVSANAFTVLYDNLGATTGGSDAAASFGPLGNSFFTGASAPTISQFDILLSGIGGDGGTFQLQIVTDNPGSGPGSTVLYSSGNISDNILSASPTDVNVSFAPVVLSASNRYWITLTADALSSVAWAWAVDNSGTGTGGEFYASNSGIFSNDDPPFPTCIFAGSACGGQPYQMRVTDEPAVATTPLPGALPLLASGLGALGIAGWRRKRKSRAA